MRILLVAHNFPPEFRGGVERVVEVTALELQRRGHEVLVLAGSERQDGQKRIDERLDELTVVRLLRAPRPLATYDLADPWCSRAYSALLEEYRPDIVHVHHWWNLCDDLVRQARAFGARTAVTLHDFFSSCPTFFRLLPDRSACDDAPGKAPCGSCVEAATGLPQALGALVSSRHAGFRAELQAADAILAPSARHARDAGQSFPTEASRIEVLPLGVPPLSRGRDGRASDGLRVLHFGHLSILKGVDVLIEAVRIARSRGGKIALVLAGRPLGNLALDEPFIEHIQDFGTGRLAELASAADIAVFPSRARESFGLVVEEALEVGLPVIVSDRGALAERAGARGLVVEAGDAQALAEQLLELERDPARLAALRAAPRGPVLRPADHVARLLALYSELSARPPRPIELVPALQERLAATRSLLIQLFQREHAVKLDPATERTTMALPAPRYGVSVAVPADEIDVTGDLISVITRTRNRKASLREAIRSVAEQTWKSVQLVVVNDGGEDVEDVVAAFRDRLDITLLQPGRVRRCRAANLALGAARGTWIAWLDDDDGYLPNHLEVLVRELRRGPERLVYTDARKQDLARQPDGSYRVIQETVPYQEEFSRLKLVQQAFIHLVTVGHHRSLFEELGGFDETIEVLEDHDMFIRFAQYHDFRRVPEVTAIFRVRDDGTNAITALKQEFVETRALLFQRYGHMALYEIFSKLEMGRQEIIGLHERMRQLEARGTAPSAGSEDAR